MKNSYFSVLLFISLLCVEIYLPSCTKLSASTSESIGRDSLVISEVLASNKTGWVNNSGELHDWIEVCNVSSTDICIEGCTLSTDTAHMWAFPDMVLNPGECVLVYAAKHAQSDPDDDLCTGFKLPKEGGHLFLSSPDGVLLSDVSYPKLHADQSYQRKPDGSYMPTYEQSPGFPNTDTGRELFLSALDKQRSSSLLIWEVQSKQGLKQNGWIELKNVSDTVVDLRNYYLSDNSDKPTKWQLPSQKLAAGKSVVVTAVGKKAAKAGTLQAPFKLGGSETVILSHDGRVVDGVNASATLLGTSIGRVKGRSGFFYFSTPTMQEENTPTPYRQITPAPVFVTAPGVQNDSIVSLTIETHGAKVYYTLNGARPTSESQRYTGPIRITKTTVVRAIAYDSEKLRSQVTTGTYILGADHTLPVVCISLTPTDFYSNQTGIYSKGYGGSSKFPYVGSNYWKKWEKYAHVEFYDGKEGFSSDCGFKIFGGFSRARDKKSFLVKFHNCYGMSRLHYNFYGEGKPSSFKSFVLRSGSQDDNGVMARDEFFTSLMDPNCPTLYVQAYKPVVVYVNAEYFGVYYIREKTGDDYIANHLNVSPESTTMIFSYGMADVGSSAEYKQLLAYVRSHDMTNETYYNYVKNRIDFQSIIDHKIGEYYANNVDIGNVRYIKSTEDPRGGKWYCVYYDMDWSFYGNTSPAFYLREYHKARNGAGVAAHNAMIDRLLRNKEFRKMFIDRFAWHLQNTFAPEHATAVFDAIIDSIKPEMLRNCQRWPKMTYSVWLKNVDTFRNKIIRRPEIIKQGIRSELNLTEEEWKKVNAK